MIIFVSALSYVDEIRHNIELDSAQYDTARRFGKIRISRRNKTKFETILSHWSVAQAGSNDEKN